MRLILYIYNSIFKIYHFLTLYQFLFSHIELYILLGIHKLPLNVLNPCFKAGNIIFLSHKYCDIICNSYEHGDIYITDSYIYNKYNY